MLKEPAAAANQSASAWDAWTTFCLRLLGSPEFRTLQ
jgi:hypothetical protein